MKKCYQLLIFTFPLIAGAQAKEFRETTPQDLSARPELTRQFINQAIDQAQYQLLPELLDIYRQTENYDTILVEYAEAILFQQQDQMKEAIARYRKIIARNPYFQPVRYRLAQALFADKQNEASLEQFRKLQAESLPPQVAQIVSQYITAIQKRSDWQWNFGLNYLHESNVNNASSSRYIYVGGVPFEKNEESMPQKANGLSYYFNLAKDWNLSGSHYLHFENALLGKSYWDNHQFDDQQNRVSLGYQFQNAKTRATVLPFYEMRWYGNRRYNNGHGVRLETSHWLTPQWQFSGATEWGKLDHRAENRAVNSTNRLLSLTALYAFNAQSYLYLGGDASREKTQNRTLASMRHTIRIGWGQEWWKGISSRINLSYGKRDFDKNHQIFNRLRKDKELNLTFTLWHRNLHFWGITPKLSYNYHRVNSNLADLYSYRRNRVYLNFERSF